MPRSLLTLFVLCLAILFGQSALASDNPTSDSAFVLIVNAETKVESLSQKELRSLFSLRRSVWADGTDVRLVTMPDGDKLHKQFIEKQLKLFPYQVKRLWDRQIFSGSAVRPLQAKSVNEVIELVGKTKGAIGYSPSSEIKAIKNEQVKIITIN